MPPAGLPGVLLQLGHQLGLTAKNPRLVSLEAKLKTELDTRALQSAFVTFRTDLARQTRTGKLDTARLDQEIAVYTSADLALRAKQVTAIRSLHDVLGQIERLQLSDALRASTRKVMPQASSSAMQQAAQQRIDRQHQEWVVALGLNDSQAGQLLPLIMRRNGSPEESLKEDERVDQEAQRQMDTLVARFQENEFRGEDSLLSPIRDEAQAMSRQVDFVQSLLALLNPDQVAKLADMLGAAANPSGRPAAHAPA
jgi:hypothetical protein